MPQSPENITSIWIANNLIALTSIIDLSTTLNEDYARYSENPNVFMEALLTWFVANSGHLQIVGFEDGVTPFEIEVQLPTTYFYNRDWDVYWTNRGGGVGQDRIEIDMDLFFADSNILDAFDLLDEANGYASELANGSIRLTFGDDILIIREGDTPLSFADVAASIDFI